jgi:hypothetical protein
LEFLKEAQVFLEGETYITSSLIPAFVFKIRHALYNCQLALHSGDFTSIEKQEVIIAEDFFNAIKDCTPTVKERLSATLKQMINVLEDRFGTRDGKQFSTSDHPSEIIRGARNIRIGFSYPVMMAICLDPRTKRKFPGIKKGDREDVRLMFKKALIKSVGSDDYRDKATSASAPTRNSLISAFESDDEGDEGDAGDDNRTLEELIENGLYGTPVQTPVQDIRFLHKSPPVHILKIQS